MRAAALALGIACGGCSLTTPMDGIFGEPPDATVEISVDANFPDVDESDGLIFPPEDTGPPCGGKGEACCTDKCNAGLTCLKDGKCGDSPACGGSGQACCGGSACNAGLLCQSMVCKTGTDPKCGGSGEACCTGGACVGGLVCSASKCVACGGSGQPCCGGASCAGGLVCSGSTCTACGGSKQPCCLGSSCGSGLFCGSGSCAPLCYLRCCDGSLQTAKVLNETECRNSYPLCADRGKVLRIQYEGRYIFVRDTAC